MDKEIFEKLRATISKNIAEELCSVQPMPSNVFSDLYKASTIEEELIREGYTPVDSLTKLMWIKKDDNNDSQEKEEE